MDEKLELIREAQAHIIEAIELLRSVGLNEYDRRTILATLQVISGKEHEWLACDRSLDNIIEELENEEYNEE